MSMETPEQRSKRVMQPIYGAIDRMEAALAYNAGLITEDQALKYGKFNTVKEIASWSLGVAENIKKELLRD